MRRSNERKSKSGYTSIPLLQAPVSEAYVGSDMSAPIQPDHLAMYRPGLLELSRIGLMTMEKKKGKKE